MMPESGAERVDPVAMGQHEGIDVTMLVDIFIIWAVHCACCCSLHGGAATPPPPAPSALSFVPPILTFAAQPTTTARFIHLAVFRRLWAIRLLFVLAVLAHVLEAWYAFARAKRAGHGDTAPLWLIQTLILGFPSTRLVIRLLS